VGTNVSNGGDGLVPFPCDWSSQYLRFIQRLLIYIGNFTSPYNFFWVTELLMQ